MSLNTCSIIFFLSFFLHAYTFAPTTSMSVHIHNSKIEDEKLKFNGRRLTTSTPQYLCNKNKKGSSSEDCKSSLHEHVTKSKGSRWPHPNIREMDVQTTIFMEEDLSETDYQPPHRKSPIHNK